MAVTGKLSYWQEHAESFLALIILVDQFPRILYPDSPECHQFDHLAENIIRAAVDAGVFFYS